MVLLYGNIRGVHFRQNFDIPIAIGLNNNYRNIGILSEVPTSDITIQKHHSVLPYSKIDDRAMTLTMTMTMTMTLTMTLTIRTLTMTMTVTMTVTMTMKMTMNCH
jgi:hypothetical protein